LLYLEEIENEHGIEPGRPEWADGNPELLKTARLWPHRIEGEGHFTALFRRLGENVFRNKSSSNTILPESFRNFCSELLHEPIQGVFDVKGTGLSLLPEGYECNTKLKTVKTGLYLGAEEHGRFVPSQSLAMTLKWDNVKRKESLSPDNADLLRYLKGETLFREGKGYILLGVGRFPLGWGKIGENGLKNLYPKGWRKTR
jgi:NOL1/NOP2/fmu family ribosome biogenesis protein